MSEFHKPAYYPAEYDPLADLYDLEYTHEHDIPFWLALASGTGERVVEYGAGTGRIAAPLAASGLRVAAVELSAAMVERGRHRAPEVEWTVGDMREVSPEISSADGFGLAICAFNSFLCLTELEDALAFLRNARESLAPGGLLGIEVSAFAPEELAETPGGTPLRHDLSRELPDGGTLERFSATRYDPAAQLMRMQLFYEVYGASGELRGKRSHALQIRATARDELELMLRLTGYEIVAIHGGFDGEPFDAGSENLIVLARRP